MKQILFVLLNINSLLIYSQESEYVKVKFVNTTDDKYKIIGYEAPLLSVQKGTRKIVTINKKFIKSINGIECPECFTPYRKDSIVEVTPSPKNNNYSVKIKVDEQKKYYYEDTLKISGKHKDEILDGIMKYFSVKQKTPNPFFYSNNNEYITTGGFNVKYRGIFLIFFNTTDYIANFTFSLKIKDEKLTYRISDIVLIPENISVKSYSYFGTNKYGFGSGFTNTKIPTSVPQKKLEVYKNRTEKRHKLFQSLDKNTEIIINELVQTINEKQDVTEMKSVEKSSDEALAELKRAKQKLELELITQEEYDKIKEELRKYIK